MERNNKKLIKLCKEYNFKFNKSYEDNYKTLYRYFDQFKKLMNIIEEKNQVKENVKNKYELLIERIIKSIINIMVFENKNYKINQKNIKKSKTKKNFYNNLTGLTDQQNKKGFHLNVLLFIFFNAIPYGINKEYIYIESKLNFKIRVSNSNFGYIYLLETMFLKKNKKYTGSGGGPIAKSEKIDHLKNLLQKIIYSFNYINENENNLKEAFDTIKLPPYLSSSSSLSSSQSRQNTGTISILLNEYVKKTIMHIYEIVYNCILYYKYIEDINLYYKITDHKIQQDKQIIPFLKNFKNTIKSYVTKLNKLLTRDYNHLYNTNIHYRIIYFVIRYLYAEIFNKLKYINIDIYLSLLNDENNNCQYSDELLILNELLKIDLDKKEHINYYLLKIKTKLISLLPNYETGDVIVNPEEYRETITGTLIRDIIQPVRQNRIKLANLKPLPPVYSQ